MLPLVALALVAGCAVKAPEAPASYHVTETKTAKTVKPVVAPADFPIPIIELSGDGAAIGAQHGEKLGEEIRTLQIQYMGKYFSNPLTRSIALKLSHDFTPFFPAEKKAEIDSLATASKVDADSTLLGQCFLDITPIAACSTVTLPASAAPDGVARFGRNLDFASFGIAQKYTRVMIYRPQGKFAFASVGWPGMIGVLSGMNEHGLSLANMEVMRGFRMPTAMPYAVLYRTVLETCKTTDEAIALIEKTPRQSANNLMIMDAAGNRALLEITPEKVTVRYAEDDKALISTNHHRGTDCDTPGFCRRYDALHTHSAEAYGKIDADELKGMLKEVSKRSTLQSMIFEPSTKILYLSTGRGAADGPFHKLDLKPYFQQ